MGGAEMAQPSGGAYADTREAAQRQSALCRGRSGGGEIAGAKYPHLTLFNLSPDGRVEFYVPDPDKPNEASRDWSSAPIHETFKVDKPPYGAEHMAAIFSKDDLSDLHAALASMTHAGACASLATPARGGAQGQRRADRGGRYLYRRGDLTCPVSLRLVGNTAGKPASFPVHAAFSCPPPGSGQRLPAFRAKGGPP